MDPSTDLDETLMNEARFVHSDGTLGSVPLSTSGNGRYMRKNEAETSGGSESLTSDLSDLVNPNVTDDDDDEVGDDAEKIAKNISGKTTTATTTTISTTTTTTTTSTTVTTVSQTAAERSPYSFSVLGNGACSEHYVGVADATDVEECAEECYKDPSCLVFSGGGSSCSLGCRISKAGFNAGSIPEQDDGQCHVDVGLNDCSYYKLSFFHQEDQRLACGTHYQAENDADTLAKCAHKCKDHDDCRQFTYGDSCEYGCRISKCSGADDCPDDKQCTLMTASSNCVLYKMEDD
jgi:hypothetical protein